MHYLSVIGLDVSVFEVWVSALDFLTEWFPSLFVM